MRQFEFILSLLDKPKETIDSIIIERPVLLGFIIFIFANFSFIISNSILFNTGQNTVILTLLLSLIINLLFLAAFSCEFHFVAELLKGRGNIISLFILLNFSLAPLLLLIPSAIIGKFIGPVFNCLATMILFAWSIYLVINSIKILYSFSTAKSVFVVLSPFIIISLVFALLMFISIAGIISLSL
ncbi:MAG: YIP1 family protein [Elusimicrobia bacterium]|nr:YIP1 family protein [Elusimicrobiota bacterium]